MEDERTEVQSQESVVDSPNGENPEVAEPEKQSHEENQKFRALRKRYEAQAKAAYTRGRQDEARERDEEINSWGIADPTAENRRITSQKDFREYQSRMNKKRLAERAEAEGRSVAELEEEDANRAYISAQRRKAEREPEEDERRAWLQADLEAFQEAHPEIEDLATFLKTLEENKKFMQFAGSRYGREPLADLYDDYVEITGETAKAAAAKAASREERGTGSGGGSGSEKLTREQQAALDEWNAAYPQKKMTAKEFLER